MTLEEYRDWEQRNAPQATTAAQQQKYRETCRKAVEKAAAKGGDARINIQSAYPFKKKDIQRSLAFLQESNSKLRELGFIDYPEKL